MRRKVEFSFRDRLAETDANQNIIGDSQSMRSLVLSSSLDVSSRSEQLARIYAAALTANGVEVQFLSLKDYPLPRFDNGT